MDRNDTIIAPATPVGEGGLAVIRISGRRARAALNEFFRPSCGSQSMASHRLYHGHLFNRNQEPLDEIMAVFMEAPRSYTCEDVAEIHCHGGPQIVKAILGLYLEYGLRSAQPGEFTYRAFLNGRLDLSQAEAVSRLIHSRSEAARSLALSQVEGRLSRSIHSYTHTLRNALVYFEAWIDFPEEELPEEETTTIFGQVSVIVEEIGVLLDSFETGKAFSEGVSILLVGRPNAGKSSLLNALLGEDRAIVTEIPGTTRDTLEESLTIGGLPVNLVDTAGFRESPDLVEMEGLRRAQKKIEKADLVLLVLDGSTPPGGDDLLALEACENKPAIMVLNKLDLPKVEVDPGFSSLPRVFVSAKTGEGLDRLRVLIAEQFNPDHVVFGESAVVTEERHREALFRCREKLVQVQHSLRGGASLEFVALDLRGALDDLGQISGETTTDEILAGIFSRFCIGK